MKILPIAAMCLVLGACGAEGPSEQQVSGGVSEEPLQLQTQGTPKAEQAPVEASSERQELPLWQSVAPMIGTSEAQAETLITSVLARHNVVASEHNVKDLVGALLRFRDQDNVSPRAVLNCMDSGVRSPTGPFWQDTIAYCVTELAG